MSEPTALEKWWDEIFPKKTEEKKQKSIQDMMRRLLNRRLGHRFTCRAMDRGIQMSIAARRSVKRLAEIRGFRQLALDSAKERAERRKAA